MKVHHPYKHREHLAMTLSMQAWVGHFSKGQWKWMICNALNSLIEIKKIKVFGYWVKDGCLFLIVDGRLEELETLLREISRALKKEIESAWVYQQELLGIHENRKQYFETYSIGGDDVFRYHPLTNTKLIGLLLGQALTSLYSDPELQKLKDALKVDPFNSYQVYRYGSESVVALLDSSLTSKETNGA